MNVAFASSSTWVSLSGRASVVNDEATLAELWNAFSSAWMEGGPENPESIPIHVQAQSAEYWDSPGSKVVQVANLVKAAVAGRRDEGDNETVTL